MAWIATLDAPGRVRRLVRSARVRTWLGAGLDVVFPPACASCGTSLEMSAAGLLCEACRGEFVDRRPACARCGQCAAAVGTAASCPRCKDRRFFFESVVRLGTYDGALRAAVLRIKDDQSRGMAIALGDLLAATWGQWLAGWNPDAVVPVPMHWSRKMWRGANSPDSIAQRLAARLGVPMADHLLARRRRTAPQARLSPAQRAANVRGAFRVRKHHDLPGARLLLVDDIMTTGATVNEASKALTRSGAAAVGVVAVARAEGFA